MASTEVGEDLDFQKAISKFSFSLYNAVDKSGNEFISPYSISSALLLLLLGTDGTTKNQMMSAIFDGKNLGNVHKSYKELNDILLERTQKGVTLAVANRLFGSTRYSLLECYMKYSLQYYGSDVELLDYGNPEQSRQRINNWVSKKTTEKIHNIIPENLLNVDTVVVLANAIYFKGTWKSQFDPNNTFKRDFNVSRSVKKQVNMMFGEFEALSGLNTDFNCKVLQLPYVGDKLSMVFILPIDDNGLSRLEKQINFETFGKLMDGLYQHMVFIQIPRFTVEAKYDLIPILKSLGMTEIFYSGQADFTKMVEFPKTGLKVSDARHKTYIEVNEEGSEAAAATTIVVTDKSMNLPFDFIADRPFLFIIRENETGTVLFIGRFADP